MRGRENKQNKINHALDFIKLDDCNITINKNAVTTDYYYKWCAI